MPSFNQIATALVATAAGIFVAQQLGLAKRKGPVMDLILRDDEGEVAFSTLSDDELAAISET